jgi:hypothetical protein
MKRKLLSSIAWFAAVIIILTSLINVIREIQALGLSQGLFLLLGKIAWLIFPAVFAVPGVLIISRQSRNLIGWLMFFPALIMTVPFPSPGFFNPNAPPVSPSIFFYLALWFDNWSWIVLMFPILMFPLLFPTGRPPSPRWNWVMWYAVAKMLVLIGLIAFLKELAPMNTPVTWTIHNPIGFIDNQVLDDRIFSILWTISLSALTLICLSAVWVRFRRGSPVERVQIKLFLYACGIFSLVYISIGFWNETGLLHNILDLLFALSMMLIPVSVATAILRHNLFDMDVIIRKTLIYTMLTGLLGLTFYGSVVSLQAIFTNFLGQQSPAAVVISTLAIAALFSPLRARIQSFINRRFFRQKYDADTLLSTFARRTRDETDLSALTSYLLDVVHETMQPNQMSLWMKVPRAKSVVMDNLEVSSAAK